MTLIVLAISWLLGILAADLLHIGYQISASAALLGAIVAIVGRRSPQLRLVGLAICFAALGGIRMTSAQVATTARSLWLLNEHGDVSIDGVIVDDPKRTQDGQRVLVDVRRVAIGRKVVAAEGLVLATLPVFPERRYGDEVVLTGQLTTPRDAERAGQFDYRDYLARKGIFSLLKPQTAVLRSQDNGGFFWSLLLEWREKARAVLLRELPEPQASLAIGILLGLQASIPDPVAADFSLTGTSHILVISGWNISIIALYLYKLADRFRVPSKSAFWVVLGTIWIYTFFVGASPTVVRAAVMGTIVVVGQRLERPAHAWTTLFAACWLMTLWNPQTLWDLGFQLSALATASLFAFGKGVEAILMRTPLRAKWLNWAREALTATLAAQILALPLILYQFGNLSLIAPLANVALLPVVPAAMGAGTLALCGGALWLPIGRAIALCAYFFLAWLTEGARWFASMPWAAVQIPVFPLWVLLAYYTIVVGAWLWNLRLAGSSSETATAWHPFTPYEAGAEA